MTTSKFVQNIYGEYTDIIQLGLTKYTSGNLQNLDTTDDLTTRIEYLSDGGDYIFDRPERIRQIANASYTSNQSKWLSATRFEYDNKAQGVLDGPGNLTRIRRWTGSPYEVLAQNTYDAHGNITQTTGPISGQKPVLPERCYRRDQITYELGWHIQCLDG